MEFMVLKPPEDVERERAADGLPSQKDVDRQQVIAKAATFLSKSSRASPTDQRQALHDAAAILQDYGCEPEFAAACEGVARDGDDRAVGKQTGEFFRLAAAISQDVADRLKAGTAAMLDEHYRKTGKKLRLSGERRWWQFWK